MTPLEEIVSHLKAGDVVGFPTDTVYGCGVSIGDAKSASILNAFKKRDLDQPVQWLIPSIEDVKKYASVIPSYTNDLIDEGWPGGLTLIFKSNDNVPEGFRTKDLTVAMRLPKCACVRKVMNVLGCPIAASSANFSGENPPQFKDDVSKEFMESLPYALTCLHGQCKDASGIPSTIIDCTGDSPKVIRK